MEDLIQRADPTAFHEKDFWDEFYATRGDRPFEWYGSWSDFGALVLRYVQPEFPTLVLGCGNSTLSHDLHVRGGFSRVISIDFSGDVVAAMRAKTHGIATLEWEVMDMTALTFGDETMGCVFDKGALDALYAEDTPALAAEADRMLREAARVLRPAGVFICITMAQDYVLSRLVEHFAIPGWSVDLHVFLPSDGTIDPAILVAATKGAAGLRLHSPLCPSGPTECSAVQALAAVPRYKAAHSKAHIKAMPIHHDLAKFSAVSGGADKDDDGVPSLGAAALAALADFAVERGLMRAEDVDPTTLVTAVAQRCDTAERDDEWTYRFGTIDVVLRGVRRDLGQTLTSTGLTLWSGADRLAEFVFAHRGEYLAGKSVVELGCGLGLVGILASKCGADPVVLTDGDASTVERLEDNVALNCPNTVGVHCLQLDWSDRPSIEAIVTSHGRFDNVLAADVCYSDEAISPLFDAAARLIHPQGVLFLSYTQRGVHPDVVHAAATKAGFTWTKADVNAGPDCIYRMQLTGAPPT